MRKKTYTACSHMTAIFLAAALMLTGCGTGAGESSSADSKETQTTEAADTKTEEQQETDTTDAEEADTAENTESTADSETSYLPDAPEVSGLTCQGKLKLDYAECYDVYYYDDDYQLIDIHDSAQYLLVPEGAEAPEGLDESIIVLQKPLDRIYLAAISR